MDSPPYELGAASRSEPDASLVELRALRRSIGSSEILNGVDLSVKEGEVVAVIGPSGAGKTSILRVVACLDAFDDGAVEVCGASLNALSRGVAPDRHLARERKKIAGRVGMVFQQFNLFPHLSVLQNITLSPIKTGLLSKQAAQQRATALLNDMGLSGRESSFPRELSGGQQQRVAIARALALEPKVMLFDEVTSALDPEVVGDVLAVMRGLANAGMTMIVVTHEMQFAREVATRLVVMDDGRIVETGRPVDVFRAPESARTRQFLQRVMDK